MPARRFSNDWKHGPALLPIIGTAPDRHATRRRLLCALLVLSLRAVAVPGSASPLDRPADLRAGIARLEKAQEETRAAQSAAQALRREAWFALLKGPFQQAGGASDDAAKKLESEAKRLDAEGRAKGEALKAEKNPDEVEALKIEIAQLRRGKEDAERAYQARVLEIARGAAGGAELVAKVGKLDEELARLQDEWGARRLQIGELERDNKPISPEPKKPVVIELDLPPPANAAERMKIFAARNAPAEIGRLAHDFFRTIDPKADGVGRAVTLFESGRFAEALDAYRDYFFEKVTSPEKFGITADAFTDDSRQFMSVRHPPESWIADAMNGIANTTAHDLGDEFVLHAKVGPPGAINWAHVADQPAAKNGRPVWLEFQRRFGRGIGNDGGYEGLRDCLLDAYILSGDARFLTRWAEYSDDWYLNWQRDADASPHNLRWADAIIPRLVCGFVSRMRLAAQCHPGIAKQMPSPTLARMLLRLQEEYMAPNLLVARTTRQNWNMMGLGFNVRNGMLLPEFKTAQWAGREAIRGINNAYLFTIMPDGGNIEYGDEGHQGVWRERVGGVLQLLEKQRPGWASAEWQRELLDTFNQNVRFWIRHLKPDGYQHRDGLRHAREVYVGGVQSMYGPQSLNTQAPWVCAEPEAKRMLENVFGPFVVPPSGGTDARKIPAEAGTTNPEHLSDVSPFMGEIILRGGWESNAPFFYMQGGRMPNSGCFDDATAFRAHAFGLNLLIASPLSVDGRMQNAHFGMVDNVGSKTEYLAYNDGTLSIGRWHSSSNFDFAECFYSGAYENKTGRQYRTTFQPGGNALRPKPMGEPAITNVSVARQVFFVRDPVCWIIVDRITSPEKHSYRQSYDLYTPVTKLDWYRRAKTPIPNAANRVVFDETKRTIRSDNPGFPNVTMHHFSSSPLRYEFDKDWHDLDKKTKGEIAIADNEWKLNRPELRDVMAFSRRVNVTMDAEGEATLVTLIVPRQKSSTADNADGADEFMVKARDSEGFEATRRDGVRIRFANGLLDAGGVKDQARLSVSSIHEAIQPVTFGPATNVFTEFVDVTMACETRGVEIRYTLDGSDPTPRSALYTTPVRLENSARVKAIAMRAGLKEIPWQLEPGLVTIPTLAVFTKDRLKPGLQTTGTKPGLAWDYFEGNQFALAATSEWRPAKKSGTTTNLFDVSMRETGGTFGVRYSGFITVPDDGVYTFHAPREFVMPDTEAGYDLRVFVDGREGEPALRRHALGDWSVALAKGAHEFMVIFVDTRSKPFKYETWRDWPNPAVLWSGVAPTLEIAGPGIARQAVPAAWLSRPVP